jgi:hypothetical protein
MVSNEWRVVVVYVFNFLDRQILSILAERIKADLGVSDAQMGFLYGTAFAVFYAIFGIPLGRLADVWDRRRLIAWGLAAWSAMTALSGLARSFAQLALARFAVGVGEASASPAAYSLLSDGDRHRALRQHAAPRDPPRRAPLPLRRPPGASYQNQFAYREELEAASVRHPELLAYVSTVSRPGEEATVARPAPRAA